MLDVVHAANPMAQQLMILLKESGLACQIFSYDDGSSGLYIPPLLLDSAPFQDAGRVEISYLGAAMTYLAGKANAEGRAGEFYPEDPKQVFEAERWVMWQSVKQAFRPLEERPELSEWANKLYQDLEIRLDTRSFIAGDHYSIADMMCYPWVVNWGGAEPNFGGFQKLAGWFGRVRSRRAVTDGMQAASTVPSTAYSLARAIEFRAFGLLSGNPVIKYPPGEPPPR